MGKPRKSCTQTSRGTPIDKLGLDRREFAVLTVARHYFENFASPERQTWLGGISAALDTYGHAHGPNVAVAVLSAVQTMRGARKSVFRFNSADCAACSAYISDQERSFLNAIRCTARGQTEAASAHAFVLCEGNDTASFLFAAEIVADACGLRTEILETPVTPPSRVTLVDAPLRGGV